MSAGKVRRRRWVHEGVKREAWGFTLTTPEGRVRKSGYLTRGEAQEAMDALKRPEPVVEPAAPLVPALTFKAALDRYYLLRSRKKSIREDRRLGAVLLARFGDIPLSEITAAKISAYKAERLAVTSSRLGAPLSVASINRPLAMLRTVLRVACREWETLGTVPHISWSPSHRAGSGGSTRPRRAGSWPPAAPASIPTWRTWSRSRSSPGCVRASYSGSPGATWTALAAWSCWRSRSRGSGVRCP